MDRWYRIFGGNDAQPAPAALLEHLQGIAAGARGDFTGDDAGWYAAVIHAGGMALDLERFLVTEEGIRAELNNWAAWLETCADNPNHAPLMERVIQTRQLFTLRGAPHPQPLSPEGRGEQEKAPLLSGERGWGEGEEAALLERLCIGLCRFLAGATQGVWQADERGFFSADGALLVPDRGEDP